MDMFERSGLTDCLRVVFLPKTAPAALLCPSGVSKRMEWLQELMGHIRNVAYGAASVTGGDPKLVCELL